MHLIKSKFLWLVPVLAMGACTHHTEQNSKPDVLKADMDTTVKPGDDFYRYANGTWLKNNPIPASESRWGIGNMVKDEIYVKLKKLSEDAAAKPGEKNSVNQRVGDLYASAMDTAAIEKDGLSPLKPELDEISAIKDQAGLVDELAKMQTYGGGPGFSMWVSQDEKNSTKMLVHFGQGGLGMPNRDYYINTDPRTTAIRGEYQKYLNASMPGLETASGQGGHPEMAAAFGSDVYKLEEALAKVSRKLEDLRDPYKNYNKMTVKDFDKLTPALNWEHIFTKAGVPAQDTVIVGQPEFFTGLDKVLREYPLETWKNYLKWQLLISYADKLDHKTDLAHFNFYGKTLTGAKAQKDRWKRVIDYENAAVGELLGQAFVKEYFTPETKQRYVKLVDAVLAAYKNRLTNEPWMSEATRKKAVEKLNAVTKKIGYPDEWKDFTGMDISRQAYVRNAINIDHFWFTYNIKKLGKPVDRKLWDMNPQEYNAYYNPSNNEIVIPAAQLIVPGYKDEELDDALVYGYSGGSTVGHEITHGFDDEGHQYDASGNLNNWWAADDEKQFKERSQRYVEQFNAYIVLDSMHVNGKASLGENIADLGGIVIGLDAFKQTEAYKSGKKISGLTPVQRYFLGYALGWMVQQRDEKLANQIHTDVHAPANLRVNGPLSNIPEFYEAFGVKKGDKLWREEKDRVSIW